MLSYHNDQAVKEKYQEQFEAHRAADEVVQGKGYENGRGCFIGCTLNNYDHEQFTIELGWPLWLALLADKIFEGLPKEEAPQFGTDILIAVPVGLNLENIKNLFLLKIQKRNLARISNNNEEYADKVRESINQVIRLLENKEASEEEAESAESAAWSAARSAARSAAESAWSAAESAAWSAAESAESAAESAWSAARSAWSAAESAECKLQRDELLELIRNCK